MKLRRVKFVWGASKVIRGRWFVGLLGIYDRGGGHHDAGIAVSVRGLLLWGATLAVAVYLAGATALYWLWNKNPYSLLTYSDAVLYPLRRPEISAKKGQAFIAQGQDMYREKKYSEAVNLLRIGLSRYPRDFRARLTLAQFYILTNQRPIALQTLQDGLTGEYPGRAYLETMFNAAEAGEDYGLVASAAARYLPVVQRDGSPADARWLGERRFAALTASQRWEEALQAAEADGGTHGARERQVLALLLLGRADEAIARLTEWRKQEGAPIPTIARLEVRAFREAKRFAEMERALTELRGLSPSEAAPRVYAVIQQAMAGRLDEASAALEDYLFRFGGTVENLLLVATPLAEIGNLTLLKRCVAAAAERGFPRIRFQVLLVQSHVAQGEWAEASTVLATLPPESGRDAAAGNAWREWMRLLIEAARTPSDPAQAALLEFLRSRPWPARIFRQSVEALFRSDRLETVRDVLVLGERGFPKSEWVRQQTLSVQEKLAARAAAAPEVAGGESRLVGEKPTFDQLERLLAAKDWDSAENELRTIWQLRPAPAWLARREADLHLAQIKIDLEQNETPALIRSTRLFLNGDESRSRVLADYAREVGASGRREPALLLAKEMIRRKPDFAPAQQLLTELEPSGKNAEDSSLAAESKSRPVAVAADSLAAVELCHTAGDVPGMLRAVRLYLNGDRARSQEILDLARKYSAQADSPSGMLLVKEVLRRTPNFPPALRLLKEWESAGKQ